MMIKKFSEFIEEGMWGSALRRSNTAKERKDDEANRIQEFIDNQPEPESIYITDGNVINSKSNITIRDTDLVDGKLPFKFGRVDKDFICSKCSLFIILEGSPKEVGGNFSCSDCTSLTTLEGTPQKVGGDFYCSDCSSLTTLEGSPQEVGWNFSCSDCPSLKSLEGSPQKVGGDFSCSYCPSLTSLEGVPKKIGGKFIN